MSPSMSQKRHQQSQQWLSEYILSSKSGKPLREYLQLHSNFTLTYILQGREERFGFTNWIMRSTADSSILGYLKALASSPNFQGYTIWDCLYVIHSDIVSVWNFNDPACVRDPH